MTNPNILTRSAGSQAKAASLFAPESTAQLTLIGVRLTYRQESLLDAQVGILMQVDGQVFPHVALFVVSDIRIESNETGPVAVGGKSHVHHPWTLDAESLTPTRYTYGVPSTGCSLEQRMLLQLWLAPAANDEGNASLEKTQVLYDGAPSFLREWVEQICGICSSACPTQ